MLIKNVHQLKNKAILISHPFQYNRLPLLCITIHQKTILKKFKQAIIGIFCLAKMKISILQNIWSWRFLAKKMWWNWFICSFKSSSAPIQVQDILHSRTNCLNSSSVSCRWTASLILDLKCLEWVRDEFTHAVERDRGHLYPQEEGRVCHSSLSLHDHPSILTSFRVFFVTPLLRHLSSTSAVSFSADKSSGYIVVETNFRLYAYTKSTLQLAILSTFTEMTYRFGCSASGTTPAYCK